MNALEDHHRLGEEWARLADLSTDDDDALDALYSDGATGWINTANAEMPIRAAFAARQIERDLFDVACYEDVAVHPTPDGFVVQYVQVFAKEGEEFRIPCVQVAAVSEGRIARTWTYRDSAADAPVFKILIESGAMDALGPMAGDGN